MRVLHTSDWHLGRTLNGISRLEEQQAFLVELQQICRAAEVDVVVVAGDIYDTGNPPAKAEELYYQALEELCQGGRRAVVVVAGNHDSPERIRAAGPLASQRGIVLAGFPDEDLAGQLQPDASRAGLRRGGQGWGLLAVPGVSEQLPLIVLPYPSERRLGEALADHVGAEDMLQQHYSERIAALVAERCRQLPAPEPALLVGHLYTQGGSVSDSERPIHLGGALTVNPQAFNSRLGYAALGHLHRSQTVAGGCPIRYSGAPLTFSFDEVGQAKSVLIVDMSGPDPAVETVVLSSGRPLTRWEAEEGIPQVYHWLETGRDAAAWVELTVHVTDAIPQEDVRAWRSGHAGLVSIRPLFPETEHQPLVRRDTLSLDELFCQFYRRQRGADPEPAVVELFLSLAREAEQQSGEPVQEEAET